LFIINKQKKNKTIQTEKQKEETQVETEQKAINAKQP